VPSFSLTLRDLAHLSDEQIKDSALEAFQQIAVWLLRDGRDADAISDHFPFFVATFRRAYETPRGIEALGLLVSYISTVCGSLQRDAFLEKIRKLLPEAEPILMTLAEQYRQEGREETLRATLRKLLALKFGPPSPEVEARINAASVEELDRYLERVVSAPDLAAVFAP
jgi:hypothetical protein